VDNALILETTYLVDLERERQQSTDGPASRLLLRYGRTRLFITDVVAGEIAAGLSMSRREVWESFLSPFRALPMTPTVDWKYGETYRYLQANGMLIGGNDLWIAAAALAYETPLVTRNGRHFRRVPGLEVITYGEAEGCIQ